MEPASLTLAGVAATTVSEGIKFLYVEAGEVLKRWWDRRDAQKLAGPDRIAIELPQQEFVGELRDPVVHYEVLAQSVDDLEDAYARLAPYVNGVKPMATQDAKFVALADRLRTLLEGVLKQRITFAGEQRQPSGTRIEARMKIDALRGDATNVELEGSGDVRSTVEATTVEAGAKLTGARVRTSTF